MMVTVRAHWRREGLYPGLAAMEICWVYPWGMYFLGQAGQNQAPPAGVWLLTLLAALYWSRWTHSRGTPLFWQRAAALVLAVVTALLFVRLYAFGNHSLGDWSWMRIFASQLNGILQHIPPRSSPSPPPSTSGGAVLNSLSTRLIWPRLVFPSASASWLCCGFS